MSLLPDLDSLTLRELSMGTLQDSTVITATIATMTHTL